MRHAAAALHHVLVTDPPERAIDAQLARDLQLVREAATKGSVRRRAGEALIAFGIRLAGEPVSQRLSQPQRHRLSGRVA